MSMDLQAFRSIEGTVILKRKAMWVKRYAKIENQIFSYKKDKNDTKMRTYIDLRVAKIKISNRNDQEEKFIQLNNATETIILAFESLTEFDKWKNVFLGSQPKTFDTGSVLSQQQISSSSPIPQVQSSNMKKNETVEDLKSQESMIKRARGQVAKGNSKFSENALNEQELQSAKQKLTQQNGKEWHLLESKENVLTYADKKGVNLSRISTLQDIIKGFILEKNSQAMKNRTGLITIIAVFAIYAGIDFLMGAHEASIQVKGFKAAFLFIILALLCKMYDSIKKADKKEASPELQLKESFEIKAVTSLMASPDEIVNLLIDEKLRPQWDLHVKTAEKKGDNTIQVTYSSPEGFSQQETIKCIFQQDKEGACFIQEQVNGDQYRFYEISPVQNRPAYVRITFFSKVTPVSFRNRGKDIFRSLGSLRAFIEQQNRERGYMPMKSDFFSSLRQTGFGEESDLEEEDLSEIPKNKMQQQYSFKMSEIKEETKEELQTMREVSPPVVVKQEDELLAQLGDFNPSVVPYVPTKQVFYIPNPEALFYRYNPENLEYIRKCLTLYEDYERRLSHPDWKISIDDTKEKLQIFQRTTEDKLQSMKATGIIDRKNTDLLKVIGNDKWRRDYDSVYDGGHQIERIADQTVFGYQKSKKIAIVSARDWVLVQHMHKTANGTIYGMAYSVEREDLMPIQKSLVRAAIPIAGWKLEIHPDDPDKTIATYLLELDLKGSIPAFVINQANKDQGYQIVKMRKTVEKVLKEEALN